MTVARKFDNKKREDKLYLLKIKETLDLSDYFKIRK